MSKILRFLVIGNNYQLGKARNANKRLRDIIAEFSDSRFGRSFPLLAEIPKRKFGIILRTNQPWLKRFWAPYLDWSEALPTSVHIVYTEHLFFFEPVKRYLVRHLDVNDSQSSGQDIKLLLPFLKEERGLETNTRAFVNSSDVVAVLKLAEWFTTNSIPVDFGRAHPPTRRALFSRKAIVIGNSRTSPIVESLQKDLNCNFRLEDALIKNLEPKPGEKDKFETAPGTNAPFFGCLARGVSRPLNAEITLIISNHGRFAATLSHALTDETLTKHLLGNLGFRDRELPPEFEAVLEVQPPAEEDNEMQGYPFAVVAKRPD